MAHSKGHEFLQALLDGMSPEEKKDLLREISKDKPAKQYKPKGEPVKTYTTVLNKYHCITCGSHFDRQYDMYRGETVCAMDDTGNVHTLNVTGKPGVVEVPHTVSTCDYCAAVISTWDRAQLERAFLDLTAEAPFCYKQMAIKKRRAAGDGKICSVIYHKDTKEELDHVQEHIEPAESSVCGEGGV
jgi:glutaredoxin